MIIHSCKEGWPRGLRRGTITHPSAKMLVTLRRWDWTRATYFENVWSMSINSAKLDPTVVGGILFGGIDWYWSYILGVGCSGLVLALWSYWHFSRGVHRIFHYSVGSKSSLRFWILLHFFASFPIFKGKLPLWAKLGDRGTFFT